MGPPLHPGGGATVQPPPPKPRGGLAALAGRREKSNPSQASVSTCTAPFKGEAEIPTLLVAGGPSTSVAVRASRCSCSAQDQGSARASAVMLRPAGAVPSRRPEIIRGETK